MKIQKILAGIVVLSFSFFSTTSSASLSIEGSGCGVSALVTSVQTTHYIISPSGSSHSGQIIVLFGSLPCLVTTDDHDLYTMLINQITMAKTTTSPIRIDGFLDPSNSGSSVIFTRLD